MRSSCWGKIVGLLALCTPVIAAPPVGFERTVVDGDFSQIVGTVPIGDGRSLTFERSGIVWVIGEDGVASESPFLDIHDEVLAYRDHGLLSIAVDPLFLENGYVYVLYAVDPHHLHLFGTPDYSPWVTWTDAASIGRLTRYQATEASDYSIVDPTSRTILIGDSITTGIPIVNLHHGLGEMHFSSDGSLLFAMGDSASFVGADIGGKVFEGFVPEALAEGIMTEIEDIGAFRSQLIDSHCGKMLRVDPLTGDGVPSNPFYDSAAPRSARSRVWAYGLRNVFRWAFVKGTGSDDMMESNPGYIVAADIGWEKREEVVTIPSAGVNLGWPLFEGFDAVGPYWYADVPHPTFTNPLAGDGCDSRLLFRDLLQEEQLGAPLFRNPCASGFVEAEDSIASGLDIDTSYGGASGSGAVLFDDVDDEMLAFSVDVDGTEPITMRVRYVHRSYAAVNLLVRLDGVKVGELNFQRSACDQCWETVGFELDVVDQPGVHEVQLIGEDSNGLRVDRIELSNSQPTLLPDTLLLSVHHRPLVDWYHSSNVHARVAGFTDEGDARPIWLTDSNCPVEGESFRGICAAGVEAIFDPRWPEEWHGYYFTDIFFGWIRVLQLDDNGALSRIREFDLTAGKIADLSWDDATGSLLGIQWGGYPVRYSPVEVMPCSGDFNMDGVVDGVDLGLFMVGWNTDAMDLDGDGITNGPDLGILLGLWGPCPEG